jgi:hypothetical protein
MTAFLLPDQALEEFSATVLMMATDRRKIYLEKNFW